MEYNLNGHLIGPQMKKRVLQFASLYLRAMCLLI